MLTAQGLTKQYGKTCVLSGVSFTLAPGGCLGVAGHNGSGKSTLLSLVAQAAPPTGGSLQYNGKDIRGDKAFMRRMVGYVPQQDALLGDLTVAETLRYWLALLRLPQSAAKVPAALMGLADIEGKRVDKLSGGMKKRLSIALALLHGPGLLLLDEALAPLDRHYRLALEEYLGAYRAAGGAVLYISHDVGELYRLCDTILLLQNGCDVWQGPAADFPRDTATLDILLNPQPPKTPAQ